MENEFSNDKRPFFVTTHLEPRKALPLTLMGFHRLFGLVSKLERKNNPALEKRANEIRKTLSKLKKSYRQSAIHHITLVK